MGDYANEADMYEDVRRWLVRWLQERWTPIDAVGYDSHQYPLNDLITRHGLQRFFASSEWQTYDIRVDVVAFFASRAAGGMAFVECKLGAITLSDLSQLLGYCRVARPYWAFLLSPAGPGGTLRQLIDSYRRVDVLEYHQEVGRAPRRIVVAKWDAALCDLDHASVLPVGTDL